MSGQDVKSEGSVPRLEGRGLCRSFASVRAVDDVSFTLAPGEILGLCGHNGAGKSTLINMIVGALAPDEGEIFLNGAPVEMGNPRDAQRLGIAWVDQELSLVPSLSVEENMSLGDISAGFWRPPWKRRRGVRDLLDLVGLDELDPAERISSLRLGERQLVEIARALGRQAQVLILDEPTATLTDVEIEQVFKAVDRVAAAGCSVVFVSHRLGEVMQICNRAMVVRDGRVVAGRPVADWTPALLVEAMLGESLEAAPKSAAVGSDREAVLVIDQLSQGTRLKAFTESFQPGRIYGLAGQVGAGASETLRAIAGLAPGAVGRIDLHKKRMPLGNPVAANAAGIGFLSNDRKSEGLFLDRSVCENLTVNQLGRISRARRLSPRLERKRAAELAEAAGVASGRLSDPVRLLSGGNQQKCLVGRFLLGSGISVLLVDEPTRGVDVGGRAAIHELLREAAEEGCVVIFASSDLDEVIEVAEVAITMRAGRVIGRYTDAVSRQELLSDLTHRDVEATA